MIAYMKFCKKIKSPYPSPISIFLFFFFQKIEERLNEIRRSQKSCTSRSIDFTHVKLKTRSIHLRCMWESSVQLDRIPTSGHSPAGPQSNQNVWLLPAISRDVCVKSALLTSFCLLAVKFLWRKIANRNSYNILKEWSTHTHVTFQQN